MRPIEFKEVTYQTALRHYLEGNEAEVNAEPRSNRKKPIPKIIPDKYLNDLLGSDYEQVFDFLSFVHTNKWIVSSF